MSDQSTTDHTDQNVTPAGSGPEEQTSDSERTDDEVATDPVITSEGGFPPPGEPPVGLFLPRCGFMTEKKSTDGEDAPPFEHKWTTESGERTLIAVFDGMGGAGATSVPSPDDPEVTKSMAFLASRGARRAFEHTVNQISVAQRPSEITRMLERSVSDELNRLLTRPGGTSDTKIRGKSVKAYPTTVAAAQIEDLPDGTRRVHCMWAGDSRVYALFPDSRLLKQLTRDHTASGNIKDGGDAALTQCLHPESTDMETKDVELPEDAIVIVATDGCFAYESLKFFLTTLVEQIDRSTDEECLARNLERELTRVAQDDCSFVASFGPRPRFEDVRSKFRPFLRDLQDLRLVPHTNPHVVLHDETFFEFEPYEEVGHG